MKIIFDEDLLPSKPIVDKMQAAAEALMQHHDIDTDKIEISVSFVSAEEIMELNTMYRGVEKMTDVLSFPQFSSVDEIRAASGQAIALGDVVIAPDIAFVQSQEYGHSVDREIVYLFVHSILHLFGYDHMEPEDKAVMRKAEERVMDELNLHRD